MTDVELTVCPVHLRFIPCRRCSRGRKRYTTDPFIVELTRRYQAGEVEFTLATDHDCGPRSLADMS